MDKIAVLHSNNGDLQLELANVIADADAPIFWIRLILTSQHSLVLGANDADYVINYLTNWLSITDDHERIWVMTLHEQYGSLYGSRRAGTSMLHVHDQNGLAVAHMSLSKLEIQSWLHELDQLPARLIIASRARPNRDE